MALDSGTIRYFESGPSDGPVAVFVHGLLVNADLWRQVVPGLVDAGFHTYAVDWPLGSHEHAMPGADLTPPGVADLITAFMDRLDLQDVTVVANDTGGALTQILMTRHPERIGRVVLTPSDSFERFFPPMFALLPRLAKVPGGTWLLVQVLRSRFVQRLPIGFGWPPSGRSRSRPSTRTSFRAVATQPSVATWARSSAPCTSATPSRPPNSCRRSPARSCWRGRPRTSSSRSAWPSASRSGLPNATIVPIADSLTFVPEDQPAELVRLVTEFAGRSVA